MPSFTWKSFKYKANLLKLFEIFKNDEFGFLLYSGLDSDGLGRFSFMGASPFLVFKSKANSVQIQTGTHTQNLKGNPLSILRGLLEQYRLKTDSLPLPFSGGAVGYFGYDLGFLLEEVPLKSRDDLNLPDCVLGFYDRILIYDHKTCQLHVLCGGFPEKNPYLSRKLAEGHCREILRKLTKFESCNFKNKFSHWEDGRINLYPEYSVSKRHRFGIPIEDPVSCYTRDNPNINLCNHNSNFTKDSYIKAIIKTKDYISRGDIYQLNLSQRFCLEYVQDAFDLFGNLSRINPAPFSAYMDFGKFQIISSSPERFLNLNGGLVHTRPMKGTRPRGRDPREDTALKKALLESPKDKAELIMIVDLERNDLGKVCSYGSVRVSQLRRLESYSTVFQTTSTVSGRLHPDKDYIDLLKACFPGGSITGCPKIRAMQIIEELEPTRRSIYTGSIGYLGFNGNMDLNIAIRTLIKKRDRVYFQVGGGIVADSVPELEYEETLVKANALFRALSLSHEPVGVF